MRSVFTLIVSRLYSPSLRRQPTLHELTLELFR
jgi:hypothetical protein